MICPLLRVLTILLTLLAVHPVFAHGGEDHGEAAAPVVGEPLPLRMTATSDLFELVGIPDAEGVTLYIDDYSTNQPVAGASVDVEADGKAVRAQAQDNGAYRLTGDWAEHPGAHNFVITLTKGETSDLLTATLTIPEAEAATGFQWHHLPNWAWVLMGLAGGVLVTGFLGRRRAFLAVLFLLGIPVASPDVAFAHGGEDHGAPEASAPPTRLGGIETARRLADGGLFIPKPMQRALGLRTQIATIANYRPAVQLLGRVVADPNRSGLVQPTTGGRVVAPAAGLPALGSKVRKGQVLAFVEAGLGGLERADLADRQAALAQEVAIAEGRLARLKRLQGTIAGRELDEASLTLKGLRQRKTALDSLINRREALVAPLDGIVASASAIVGQVVGPDAPLFQIVDPGNAMVEAQSITSIAPTSSATGRLSDGRALSLSFAGQSQVLENQGRVVRFRITAASADVGIGNPVTVLAPYGAPVSGIVMPRTAVISSTEGGQLVFIKRGPEQFMAAPVRVLPYSAQSVLVQNAPGHTSFQAGDRIVSAGADLLAQVR